MPITSLGAAAVDPVASLVAALNAASTKYVHQAVSTPTTAPAAPTAPYAIAGPAQATVYWTPPTNAPVTSYTVTASPGGATATATAPARQATVTGLTNGTAHTFTITATNSTGTSSASSATIAVTPSADPGGLGISGCVTWYKADALALSDGDAVATWTDSSGNGLSATQSTSANRPTYLASWTNSKPALTFDGTNDTLLTPITHAVLGGNCTFFVAVDIAAFSGDRRVFCNQTASTDSAGNLLDTNASVWRCILAGQVTATSAAAALNTPTVVSITSPGYEYINGAKSTGNAPGSVISSNPYWLGSLAGNQKQFPGRIAEFIAYARVLTDAERHSVETYLSAKYGITVVAE